MTVGEPGSASRKVVIDAGAAIKLQRLDRFGGALYTTGGVIREVRDEKARALLETLPEEIRIREPEVQDISFTKQFAKATGDLGFLSANDIELIALTVALHRESGGVVRDRPSILTIGGAGSSFAPPARAAPGTDNTGANDKVVDANTSVSSTPPANTETLPSTVVETTLDPQKMPEPTMPIGSTDVPEACACSHPEQQDDSAAAEDEGTFSKVERVKSQPASATVEVFHDGDSDSEDGSSGGEWVTKDNLHNFRVDSEETTEDMRVTCATSDYSVQNVLLQMGIKPLTFDGYAVKSVKLWGLTCRACFAFTRDTKKSFCPKCGNDTLMRVPIIVGPDGKPTVMDDGRKMKRKGTIYSIPKNQGGRSWQPILAEDELLMNGRDRERRHLENLYEKERQNRNPFDDNNGARGWYQRGHTSTGKTILGSAPRAQPGYGRRNPNANNFRPKDFARSKKR